MIGLRHIADENSKIPGGSLIVLIGLDREDNQSFGNLLGKTLNKNDIGPATVAPYPITSKGQSRMQQWGYMGEDLMDKKKEANLKEIVLIERIDPDSTNALGPLATAGADIVLRVVSKNRAVICKNRYGNKDMTVVLSEDV